MAVRDNESYLSPQQATILRAVTQAAENLRTVRSVAEMEIKQRVQEAVRSAELKRDDLIREAHGMGVKDASLKRAIGNKNHENLKRILGSYVPTEATSVPQFEIDLATHKVTAYWYVEDGVRVDTVWVGEFTENWFCVPMRSMMKDPEYMRVYNLVSDSADAAVKELLKEEN